MNFKKIKMVVTDMDGTLLRNDKSLSDYTLSVLKRCRQKGLLVVYATGRPERATKNYQHRDFSSYIIANNGASLSLCGEEFFSVPIPDKTRDELIRRFVAMKSVLGIIVETGDTVYTNEENHRVWSTNADWNAVETDFSSPINDPIYKFSVNCEDFDAVAAVMRDYPEIQNHSCNGEPWFHMTHTSASKYSGVMRVAELAGISAENEVIVFGDDYNDLEMIQKIGVGVAVENAAAKVKAVADYICDSNENDGMAKFLEQHILS